MSIGRALENIIGTSTIRGPIVRKGAGLIISLLAGGCLRQVEQCCWCKCPSKQVLHSPCLSLTSRRKGLLQEKHGSMHLPWRYLQVTHGILKAGPSTFQQARQTWHATEFASQNSYELSMLIECVRWLRESKFSHLWLANICIAPEMSTLEYFSQVPPKLDNEILGNPIFRQSIHVAPSNCTKTAGPTGT